MAYAQVFELDSTLAESSWSFPSSALVFLSDFDLSGASEASPFRGLWYFS